MRKTRKNRKGGSSKAGLRIMGVPIFEFLKPSIIDGRTCYAIGPIKWCTRKK